MIAGTDIRPSPGGDGTHRSGSRRQQPVATLDESDPARQVTGMKRPLPELPC